MNWYAYVLNIQIMHRICMFPSKSWSLWQLSELEQREKVTTLFYIKPMCFYWHHILTEWWRDTRWSWCHPLSGFVCCYLCISVQHEPPTESTTISAPPPFICWHPFIPCHTSSHSLAESLFERSNTRTEILIHTFTDWFVYRYACGHCVAHSVT